MKKSNKFKLTILGFVLLLILQTSCQPTKDLIYFNNVVNNETMEAAVEKKPDYKIRQFDNLFIDIRTSNPEVNQSGTVDYLLGGHKLNELVVTTGVDNLSVLNAGPIPPNHAELLENKHFTELITEAKKEYDVIMIDNAPVGMVTDGIITGNFTDVNLFILCQGKSYKKQVQHINEFEQNKQLSNVGFVLNDLNNNSYSYRSYGNKDNGYYVEGVEHRRRNIFSKFFK